MCINTTRLQNYESRVEIKKLLVKNVSNELIPPYRFINILRLEGMAISRFSETAVSLFYFLTTCGVRLSIV